MFIHISIKLATNKIHIIQAIEHLNYSNQSITKPFEREKSF